MNDLNSKPQAPAPAQHVPASQPMSSTAAPASSSRRRTWLPWTILVVVILVVAAVLGFIFRSKIWPTTSAADKLSGYQAVFLTNGQVYFGKISDTNNDYVMLHDIFYLQVNQALQPDGTTGTAAQQAAAAAAAANTSNAQTQLSLVKLGNELHGPADQMFINRDQILFYEDLKASGQVAQAIVKYNETNGTSGATNSNPSQGTQQAPAATTGTGTPPTGTAPAATGTATGH